VYLYGVSKGQLSGSASDTWYFEASGAANGVNNITFYGLGTVSLTNTSISYRQTVSNGAEINSSTQYNLSDMAYIYNIKYNGSAVGNISVKKANGTVIMTIPAGNQSPQNTFYVCPVAACSISGMIYSNDATVRYKWKLYDHDGDVSTMYSWYNGIGTNDKFPRLSFKQGQTAEVYAYGYAAGANVSVFYERTQ
jgi:hypothetical protein